MERLSKSVRKVFESIRFLDSLSYGPFHIKLNSVIFNLGCRIVFVYRFTRRWASCERSTLGDYILYRWFVTEYPTNCRLLGFARFSVFSAFKIYFHKGLLPFAKKTDFVVSVPFRISKMLSFCWLTSFLVLSPRKHMFFNLEARSHFIRSPRVKMVTDDSREILYTKLTLLFQQPVQAVLKNDWKSMW